jgi:nucleoside-diphosphate-sugar epimerase
LIEKRFVIEGVMRVFIIGVAGFIGSTLAHLLLDQGHQVAGIDSLNGLL